MPAEHLARRPAPHGRTRAARTSAFCLALLCASLAETARGEDATGPSEPPPLVNSFAPTSQPDLDVKPPRERAFTFYGGQWSSEEGWEDVMADPFFSEYANQYLVVGALSQAYADLYGGRVQVEWEGQVAFNFGAQEYWEFNAIPLMLRWKQWPWTHSFGSSAAFGIGLSYTEKLSDVEVELENETHQLLVYWVAEVTAGPYEGPWEISLRLHHRSVAYGLMGEDGGMNAIGMGMRWKF